MSTKNNTIQELAESVTTTLKEVVSLKETCRQQETAISDLNNRNHDLSLELDQMKGEVTRLDEIVMKQQVEVEELQSERDRLISVIRELEREKNDLSGKLAELKRKKTKLKLKPEDQAH